MKLGELTELVFEIFPHTIDLTPEGEFVPDDTSPGVKLTEEELNYLKVGKGIDFEVVKAKLNDPKNLDMGYYLNSENYLQIKVLDENTVQIYYVDEDGEECGCYYLGEEVDEDGIVTTENGEEYLNVDELDKFKLIALFSKKFGWIERFEHTIKNCEF